MEEIILDTTEELNRFTENVFKTKLTTYNLHPSITSQYIITNYLLDRGKISDEYGSIIKQSIDNPSYWIDSVGNSSPFIPEAIIYYYKYLKELHNKYLTPTSVEQFLFDKQKNYPFYDLFVLNVYNLLRQPKNTTDDGIEFKNPFVYAEKYSIDRKIINQKKQDITVKDMIVLIVLTSVNPKITLISPNKYTKKVTVMFSDMFLPNNQVTFIEPKYTELTFPVSIPTGYVFTEKPIDNVFNILKTFRALGW